MFVVKDAQLLQHFEPALSAHGARIVWARHGMHGYWLAMTEVPKVLVTDIPNPDDDQNYFLDYLKKTAQTSHIPIVMLCEQLSWERMESLRAQGVAMCLERDIDPEQLAAEVHRLLTSSHAGGVVHTMQTGHSRQERVDAFFSTFGEGDRQRTTNGGKPAKNRTVHASVSQHP